MVSTGWYYMQDGQEFGPVTSRELRERAASGELGPLDHVRKGESGEWRAACQVKGLFGSAGPQAPAGSASQTSTSPATLVKCQACSAEISSQALNCPRCGHPNERAIQKIHPQVQRFIDTAAEEDFGLPPFEYMYLPDSIHFNADRAEERGALGAVNSGLKLMAAGFLMFLFFLVTGFGGPLLFAAAVLIIAGLVFLLATAFMEKPKLTDMMTTFAVDFSVTPPRVNCDDPQFWAPLYKFFKIPIPRPRSGPSAGPKSASRRGAVRR
jgi:DNA-directed RNA polymerase subunit RPC12/RpoP